MLTLVDTIARPLSRISIAYLEENFEAWDLSEE